MNRSKKIDFWVLSLLILIGIILVVLTRANFLSSYLIFLGIPSLYLILRKTQNLKVIFSGVFLIGIILGFVFDFLATFNNAWIIPDEQLTIPYRVLGVAPVDELICLVLWTLLILLVYEHFFEKKKIEKIHIKHFIYSGIIPALLSVFVILFFYFLKPSVISFQYAYLILGILAAVPLIYFSFVEPKALHRVIKAAPYFILLFFAFELTSLYLGQWNFPGQYIGYIELFSLRFPLEELIFWIVTSSTVVLADYKLFINTDK